MGANEFGGDVQTPISFFLCRDSFACLRTNTRGIVFSLDGASTRDVLRNVVCDCELNKSTWVYNDERPKLVWRMIGLYYEWQSPMHV